MTGGERQASELIAAIDLLTDDKYRPPKITNARFLVLRAAKESIKLRDALVHTQAALARRDRQILWLSKNQ